MTVTVTYFYSRPSSNMELLCSLPTQPPIMKTVRRYVHKTFYERRTREWGTHFHQFYWLSTVKVKIVETLNLTPNPMVEMVEITSGLVPNTMGEMVEITSALVHHTFCNWFKENFNAIS